MSVLVTGGAGYIGSAMVELLRAKGQGVVVLDNLSSGHRAAVAAQVPFYQGDLSDTELLRRIIREHKVAEVIHFAAFIVVPESVTHPDMYFQNNTVNAMKVLDVMRAEGVGKFIFSSTAAVYGEPQYNPIDEGHGANPTNPYGHSKRFIEIILDSYDRAYGLKYVALRYFNASGGAPERGEDHKPESHLIPLVLQVPLGQREAVMIYGDDFPTRDGTCVRDYIHIADLTMAHLLALDYLRKGGASQILNLGNGAGYTVKEVIETARRVTGHPIPARIGPRRPGDSSTLVASSERARTVLGWTPAKPDLETIIASAWQWHKTHPKGYGDRA
ncbi:MAG: UDP-glucose 4-epimerase GalE [Candidatus Sumerlaeota bacterium]|nr:UDP-glucose 4-epimerase GalE [Candidatus Sumerlaeota bacterium]